MPVINFVEAAADDSATERWTTKINFLAVFASSYVISRGSTQSLRRLGELYRSVKPHRSKRVLKSAGQSAHVIDLTAIIVVNDYIHTTCGHDSSRCSMGLQKTRNGCYIRIYILYLISFSAEQPTKVKCSDQFPLPTPPPIVWFGWTELSTL